MEFWIIIFSAIALWGLVHLVMIQNAKWKRKKDSHNLHGRYYTQLPRKLRIGDKRKIYK